MQNHPAFRTKPTLCQLARAGMWERAWSFPSAQLPDEGAIASYLEGTNEVAFEAFFGKAFFGARYCGEAAPVERFALACVRAVHEAVAGAQFFTTLRTLLRLPSLGEKVSFAEVGAVNAWRSIGAYRIEQPYNALARFSDTWAALSVSGVARDTCYPKAIEFAFDKPLPHWFAFPVSGNEPPFAISASLLREALDSLTNVQQSRAGQNAL